MRLTRLFHCSPSAMTLKELEAFAAEVYSKTSESDTIGVYGRTVTGQSSSLTIQCDLGYTERDLLRMLQGLQQPTGDTQLWEDAFVLAFQKGTLAGVNAYEIGYVEDIQDIREAYQRELDDAAFQKRIEENWEKLDQPGMWVKQGMEQPLISESRDNLTTKSLEEIFSSGLNEMVGDYHAKNDQLNAALQQMRTSIHAYVSDKAKDPMATDLSQILSAVYQVAIANTYFLQAVASDMDTTVELFQSLRYLIIKKFLDFDDSLMDMDDRMDTFSDVVYELKEQLEEEFPVAEEEVPIGQEEEASSPEDSIRDGYLNDARMFMHLSRDCPDAKEEEEMESSPVETPIDEPDYHDPMDEPDDEQEDPDDDPSDEPDDDSYAYEEDEDDEDDEDWTRERSLQRRYPDPVPSPELTEERERHMSRDQYNELQDLEWELLRIQREQEQSRKRQEELERDREIERDLDRGWSRDR